jgi:chaperonin GroEL
MNIYNLISFDKKKLVEGVDILYDAVAPSLGPRAYTGALDEGYRRRVLDDGVEIAKRILLKDQIQNFGANIVTEAAKKTADEAGDSTTATIILAHAIIHESLKLIENGAHPMALRVGLEEGTQLLIDEVDKIKTPIKGLEQAIQIATISCKDPKLGELVAKTIDEMGQDGIVTVEESPAHDTYVDFQKGMRFESGYAHPAFVTHPEQMEAVYASPKILILDKAISFEGLMELFSEVQKKGLSIVIIAPDLDPRMGSFLIENKRKGAIQALYIKAPYAANFQKDLLQDLAILTGATYIPLTEGARLEDIKFSDLGECEKIVSTHNSTLIIGGMGDPKLIKSRIISLKALVKTTPSDFDSDKLRERLAKLTTGIAVIKVGGSTEVEMLERKERAIDAVSATKAALEDGIVIGGEMAYFQLLNIFTGSPNEYYGSELILYNALQKPFEQLLTNSGLDVGMYKEKLTHNTLTPYTFTPNLGVDVTTGQVVNMIEKGIIDPAKVIKCALKNAVSVAIQLLTINVVIAPGDHDIKGE